ncbi:MAG TPA: DUF2493 domain-containing protein [Nitrosopumilaceae archaeon]|nr:DUF2493 domain-containing protein [Nitrosopumilaceae archaeon]
MKQVIVTGGRDYNDWATVKSVLDFHQPDVVIQGGAKGADRLARVWAMTKGIEPITVDAEWTKHGRAAGPIRNREMLDKYPNAFVIAFPGDRGTADCVRAATERNRIIFEVYK